MSEILIHEVFTSPSPEEKTITHTSMKSLLSKYMYIVLARKHVCNNQYFYRQIIGYGMSVDDHRVA